MKEITLALDKIELGAKKIQAILDDMYSLSIGSIAAANVDAVDLTEELHKIKEGAKGLVGIVALSREMEYSAEPHEPLNHNWRTFLPKNDRGEHHG